MTANYAKGSGKKFFDWKNRYQPGKCIFLSYKLLGETAKILIFEDALPVYNVSDDMLDFTLYCLLMEKNLLQFSLFFALGSMEVIHASVVVPMCWLAGNSHKQTHLNCGELSMGHVIDVLYGDCDKLKLDRTENYS